MIKSLLFSISDIVPGFCLPGFYRGMEQLAAHLAHNQEVAGSNPAPATKAKESNPG